VSSPLHEGQIPIRFKVMRSPKYDRNWNRVGWSWRVFELAMPESWEASWFGDEKFRTWEEAMDHANWAAREGRGLNGPTPFRYYNYANPRGFRFAPEKRTA
jgi:hypothetical protein